MIQSPIGHRNASFRDWAPPPWTCHSPEWLAIDAKLPPDHLARHITKVVERLDLTALYQTYSGRGSLAHRPDLMLKVVLYEMQRGRHRPSQWAEDFIDSRAVSWLALGMQVSRTRCYAFRDRLTPLLDAWQQQLLHQAIDIKLTPASRSALDGSSVAANATRHQLINRDTLNQRLAVLESVMAADACDAGRRLSPLASESVEPVRTTSSPPPATALYTGAKADTVIRTWHIVVHGFRNGNNLHTFMMQTLRIAQRIVTTNGNEAVNPKKRQVVDDLRRDIVDVVLIALPEMCGDSTFGKMTGARSRGM